MAWQLIYTSAPRLLEAGRSGFGTIARHRDIPPLAVATIERFSQFSRQPGFDPMRIIYAHRILTISGQQYHVLSCIRDAGADYTGRTNHIAHHVIAPAGEVANLGASPADVLLQMPWVESWSGLPRWFDADEEILLSGVPPATGGDGAHWAALTGDAQHAQLLTTGEYAHGCTLIAPASLDVRPHFAESLSLAGRRNWQYPLTTSLQPTDEPTDFRWITVTPDSPLCPTDTASRPTLDLSRPQTFAFLATPAPAPPTRQIPATYSVTYESSDHPAPNVAVTSTSSDFAEQRITRKEGLPEPIWAPQRKSGYRKLIALVGVAIAISIGIASFGAYRYLQLKQVRTDAAERIPELVKDTEEASRALIGLKWRARTEVPGLATAAESVSNHLVSGSLDQLDALPLRNAITKLDQSKADVAVYRKLLNIADETKGRWQGLDGPREIGTTLKLRQDSWNALTSAFASSPPPQRALEALRKKWLEREAQALAVAFENNAEGRFSLSDFEKAIRELEGLMPSARAACANTTEKLDAWRAVVANEKVLVGETWPEWLKKLAHPTASPAGPNMATGVAPAPGGLPAPPAPAVPSHFAVGTQGVAALRIPEVREGLKFHYSGANSDPVPLIGSETLRQNVNDPQPLFSIDFVNKTISPGGTPWSWRLTANDGEQRVFTIRAVVADNPNPERHTLQLVPKNGKLRLEGKLPGLGEFGGVPLLLEFKTTSAPIQTLTFDADQVVDLEPIIRPLREKAEKLRKSAAAHREAAKKPPSQSRINEKMQKQARGYVRTLNTEGTKSWSDKVQNTPTEIVGDFAVALADSWKDKESFEKLRDLGKALSAPKADVKSACTALMDEVTQLRKKNWDGDKHLRFGELESLARHLGTVIDETVAAQKHAADFQAKAEEDERNAAAIDKSPILSGQLPSGGYRLSVQSTAGGPYLVATLSVP